jgi:glycosyltransferase involved in cell wall biosynthesis
MERNQSHSLTRDNETLRFSVVVCTYNRAAYLSGTLESIAQQTYSAGNFEIIIVDNNSPDDTADICQAFINQYSSLSVRYINELNQGISYARNRGVSEAKGTFIAFLDDDETVEPCFLQNLDAFFRLYPDAELCSEPVVPVLETPTPVWMSPFTMRLITGAYDKGKEIKTVGAKDYPGTGHATFRTVLFYRYGGFNTDLGRKGTSLLGAEDKDFFLRLIQKRVKCYYVPSAIIYHHIPAYKLTEEFFNRITYAIGKSERIRTLSISKSAYGKKIGLEIFKWGGSVVLWFYYLFKGQPVKGYKLLMFRYNVMRGLLGNY